MTRKSLKMSDELYDYLLGVSLRETPLQAQLREATMGLPLAEMQISPEQGQFMALLVELLDARQVIEVGTFTGYSALAVALALPQDGQIVACDIDEETTATGRRYWREAGVDDKIDLRLGPARETLDALIAEGRAATFDFAFIDADKENYDAYYERVLTLLRPGGLALIDNVLWSGAVADPDRQDQETRAIRDLNAKIHGDQRVSLSLLPISDGITLARKR